MRSPLAGLRRLVVPWGARGAQPRVVIATDDPLAETYSDAAIAFYFNTGQGFVTSVERAGTVGIFRLSASPAGAPFNNREEYLHAEYDETDPTLDIVTVGAGNRSGVTTHFRSYVDLPAPLVTAGVAEIRGDRIDIIGPVNITGDVAVSGHSPGKWLAETIRTVPSGAFVAETVVDTLTFPVVAGRRYRMVWLGGAQSTNAGDDVTLRLRHAANGAPGGVIAGAVFGARQMCCPLANKGFPCGMDETFTPGATGNWDVALTMARTLGAGFNISSHGAANAWNTLQAYAA